MAKRRLPPPPAIQEIITDTVTPNYPGFEFVQAKDRTKIRVKRDELDTLTEVWTGPSVYEDIWIPAFGAVHPSYNLMTILSTSVRRLEAGMAEVTLTYHGKMENGGASGYTSVPTVNKYWSEGEVTFQVNAGAGYTAVLIGAGGAPFVYSYNTVGIASYARRYTGKCIELSYITNRVPTGFPSNIGLAKGFLGFLNVWDTMTGFTPGMVLSGGGTIEQMAATDVRVEDTADGWWRVTETYMSRMFPGPVGFEHPPPAITSTTHITDAPVDQQNTDTTQGKDQNVVSFSGAATGAGSTTGNTYGAAPAQAAASGYSVNNSDPSTVSGANAAVLGMDPAWGSSTDTGAAVGADASSMYGVASGAAAGAGVVDSTSTLSNDSAGYDW